MSLSVHPDDESLLARIPPSELRRNGIPDEADAAARERAAEIVAKVVQDVLRDGGLRTSILGAGWSQDLDLHVTAFPEPSSLARLGWVPLDDLLGRLGVRGNGRWAIVEGEQVLAPADLTLDPVPNAVASLLGRCRRRGELRAREVLELRALLRGGATLPSGDPVLAVAAGVEAGLGGDLLAPWRAGPPVRTPASLPTPHGRSTWRGLRRAASRFRRRRRLSVAISGVDGAGKSSLAKRLVRDFERVRVPVTVVWTRPGMGLGWVDRLGRLVKRLLRQQASPGVERIGAGEGVQAVASRRGLIGWTWALMVTASFIRQIRKEHRRGRGVLLYDRHLLDALVTLDVVYEGVRLELHRVLVRRLVPKADATLLLTVPPATALARKPHDMFVESVLRRQAERYSALKGEAPRVRELDGTLPTEQLAAEAFRFVAEAAGSR